ncbi:MAG: nucleotidyltransferase domain-containing protein [Candidatus Cloacimonetes bacterium]|nr:nucleotidyltransferase domain-containing protein [Candidatus Cloacimonadota bacterium]
MLYTQKDIREVKEIIQKVLNPEKIILFGSYATGRINDGSDLDLMILVKDELTRKEKRAMLFSLRSLFFDNDFEVDLILNSINNFNAFKEYIGSIYYSASRDGKVLWTKN